MSLKGLSIPKQRELEQLARTIKASHEATCQMAKRIREQCNEAVAEAILCGRALIRAKRICGHGRWLHWLREKCSKVSIPTAQRYMRLANKSHVIYLDDAKSLRQAYLMVGVIPETEQLANTMKSESVQDGDASRTVNAGQLDGTTAVVPPPSDESNTPPRHIVRTVQVLKPEVGPATQPLVLRPASAIPAPVPANHSLPQVGSKRLHHLETLVQSITDILDEITPAEEMAAREALRPICEWVASQRGVPRGNAY